MNLLWIAGILLLFGVPLVVFFLKNRSRDLFAERITALQQSLERMERIVREDIAQNRGELAKNLQGFSETFVKQIALMTEHTEERLEKMREVVQTQLKALQEDNSAKLEKMRETVDEKLHATLEKRLGEKFNLVGEQLSRVHKDLGEMRNLASDVGDLKKVMSNVKTRGTWGEVQLGNLLEQILTPDQYETNVAIKRGSNDRVEFAVRMPGKGEDVVLLPIDAKFPIEDYQRLQDAQDKGDKEALEDAIKALEQQVKTEARKIRDKYLSPPKTTDFAVMYLPTEGLYAEVLRQPGLFESVQRDLHITLAGPTTISAILLSLQMGFRTLAVEKRASEVWRVLGGVKKEFGEFGKILEKTQEKLDSASKEIGKAQSKTRNIERKLDKVQELPASEMELLPSDEENISN